MKPNIIFLDMDGVLCNPRACIATGNTEEMYSYLDPIACQLVKRLCDECNARIVMSSAWRKFYDRDGMQAILNAACAGLGNKIISESDGWWRTPSASDPYSVRGDEIATWIGSHSHIFERFVILDDNSDMAHLMDSFVMCDPYDGIGYRQFIQAKGILMNGVKEDIKW